MWCGREVIVLKSRVQEAYEEAKPNIFFSNKFVKAKIIHVHNTKQFYLLLKTTEINDFLHLAA